MFLLCHLPCVPHHHKWGIKELHGLHHITHNSEKFLPRLPWGLQAKCQIQDTTNTFLHPQKKSGSLYKKSICMSTEKQQAGATLELCDFCNSYQLTLWALLTWHILCGPWLVHLPGSPEDSVHTSTQQPRFQCRNCKWTSQSIPL